MLTELDAGIRPLSITTCARLSLFLRSSLGWMLLMLPPELTLR
ncbi:MULTISPECIES: hypothetical protein [unclassified Pseudomonas]|nr:MULTISPECIES: hypothetical protein [unclassified Pseudomonas]